MLPLESAKLVGRNLEDDHRTLNLAYFHKYCEDIVPIEEYELLDYVDWTVRAAFP